MRTRVARGVVRGWQPLVGRAYVLEWAPHEGVDADSGLNRSARLH
jgi:hypothetical protein